MKFINRLFSKIFAFLYLFLKISKLKWIKNHDKNAEIIVWIKTNPLTTLLRYLKHNDLLSDFALIESIATRNIPFKIVVGKNKQETTFFGKMEVIRQTIYVEGDVSCEYYFTTDLQKFHW